MLDSNSAAERMHNHPLLDDQEFDLCVKFYRAEAKQNLIDDLLAGRVIRGDGMSWCLATIIHATINAMGYQSIEPGILLAMIAMDGKDEHEVAVERPAKVRAFAITIVDAFLEERPNFIMDLARKFAKGEDGSE